MTVFKTGFVLLGGSFSQLLESPTCALRVVGIMSATQSLGVAREMVAEGCQLIELCGGFNTQQTAAVIDSIGGTVPVGVVRYGPEFTERLHLLFGK